MSKKIILISIGIVAVVLVGFFVLRQSQPAPPEQPTVEAPSASEKYITEPKPVKLGKIPSGAEIVYRGNDADYIYVMDKNGQNVTQITFETPRQWEHAAVSFDHRYVAANGKSFQSASGELWIFDLEKGTEARLLPDYFEAGGGGVDWSPDGFIYFSAIPKDGEARNIYKIRPDGSEFTRLTHLVRALRPPQPELAITGDVSVSPDGKKVAYVRTVLRNTNSGKDVSDQPLKEFAPHVEVWVMNSDGSNQKRVNDGGDEIGMYGYDWIGAYDPEISPDGKQMVFSQTNTAYRNKPQNTAHDIWIANLDGTGLRRITERGPISIVPDWRDNLIIFTEFHEKDGYAGASIINTNGTSKRRIKSGAFMAKWIPSK